MTSNLWTYGATLWTLWISTFVASGSIRGRGIFILIFLKKPFIFMVLSLSPADSSNSLGRTSLLARARQVIRTDRAKKQQHVHCARSVIIIFTNAEMSFPFIAIVNGLSVFLYAFLWLHGRNRFPTETEGALYLISFEAQHIYNRFHKNSRKKTEPLKMFRLTASRSD